MKTSQNGYERLRKYDDIYKIVKGELPATNNSIPVSLDWDKIRIFSDNDKMKHFHSSSRELRREIFLENPSIAFDLLLATRYKDDVKAPQFALSVLYELVKDDSRCNINLMAAVKTIAADVVSDLLAQSHRVQNKDHAIYMLATIACHVKLKLSDTKRIASYIIEDQSHLFTLEGRLDALSVFLRSDENRQICMKMTGFSPLIKNNLSSKVSPILCYRAAFCVWILTFNKKYTQYIHDTSFIRALCNLLKDVKSEKVVRLVTRSIVNCMNIEANLEVAIEDNIIQLLMILEYEKWRDEDTYTEIQNGITALQSRIRQYSSFDRYKRELATRYFKWSILHTDKFWHHNVMKFEENEFEAIKSLVHILSESVDFETIAVVCFDIGEFARLHPTGKSILEKFNAKQHVIKQMQLQNRDVCREALICLQKIMLEKWDIK